MKTTMAVKPHRVAWKPLLMLSRPRLGPTVRSSMISIGAASEPARIRSARSRVSFGVKAPVIWKRLPNSPWMVATEIASPLPFSNRMIAISFFRFSRVAWRMTRPPASSSSTATAGRWSWSKVACAPMNWSPVTSTCFLTGTCPTLPSRRRSGNRSTPKCDAELVDALVQGLDVLLQRGFLHALLEVGLDRGDEQQVLAIVALGERQVGNIVEDEGTRLLTHGGLAEADADHLAVARDAAVADVLLAQLVAQVAGEVFHALGDGGRGVHLQEKMHAATQVESQVHRQRLDRGQPARP